MDESSSVIGKVNGVLTGRAVAFTRPGSASAIAKVPIRGPVWVGLEGLTGDEQGDRRAHGGPDKAVHVYAFEHYRAWVAELGDRSVLQASGAFGENLSTSGLTEANVCLGDKLRIGHALFEVSQPRQPCWKLNDRFQVDDMARRVQATLRAGWYLRILEPESLEVDCAITLVARPHPRWPLLRLLALLYARPLDQAELIEASALPLVPSWQRLIAARLATGAVEDWTARLDGPPRAADESVTSEHDSIT
jgi:MOSC domain-containing protein YiiM